MISPKLFADVLEYAIKSVEWYNKGINVDRDYII